MGKVEDAVGKVGPPWERWDPRGKGGTPTELLAAAPRRCLQGGDLGGSPVEKLWGATHPRISGGAAAFGAPPGPRRLSGSPQRCVPQPRSHSGDPPPHLRGHTEGRGRGGGVAVNVTAPRFAYGPRPRTRSALAPQESLRRDWERDGRAQVGGTGPAAEPQRPQTRLGRRPTQE